MAGQCDQLPTQVSPPVNRHLGAWWAVAVMASLRTGVTTGVTTVAKVGATDLPAAVVVMAATGTTSRAKVMVDYKGRSIRH